ncbi:MAG: hypothetical protein KDA58_09855 [Planctomycetaceae bacterium]|nr:hypothetical protein [Planctomycetaceae bacterium]
MSRTGTLALAEALEILGLRVIHNSNAVAERLQGIEHLSQPDDRFASADAWLDGPLWQHWRTLRQLWPDCRLILTTRDMEDWLRSRIIHMLHHRVCKPHRHGEIDTQQWQHEWTTHHTDIHAALSNDPHLLKLNIPAGDGWQKLCTFYNVPIPQDPFPHCNTSDWRLNEIMARLEGRIRGEATAMGITK